MFYRTHNQHCAAFDHLPARCGGLQSCRIFAAVSHGGSGRQFSLIASGNHTAGKLEVPEFQIQRREASDVALVIAGTGTIAADEFKLQLNFVMLHGCTTNHALSSIA
jgi:hypothetical protein